MAPYGKAAAYPLIRLNRIPGGLLFRNQIIRRRALLIAAGIGKPFLNFRARICENIFFAMLAVYGR